MHVLKRSFFFWYFLFLLLLLAFGFCWLLASIGFLASVCFFAFVGFWLLLAFWLCWLFNISKNDQELYRNAAFWLALASGDFCFFFFFLLLLLFCWWWWWWWWWWWEQPGLHAWGGGAAPSPTPPALRSLTWNSVTFLVLFLLLFLVVCYTVSCYDILVLFLVCICWWFAIACYIVCYVVRDNDCDIILYDILYDIVFFLHGFVHDVVSGCFLLFVLDCLWFCCQICLCLVDTVSQVFLIVCHPEPSNILAKWNRNAVKSSENIKICIKPKWNIAKWEHHISNWKEKTATSKNYGK